MPSNLHIIRFMYFNKFFQKITSISKFILNIFINPNKPSRFNFVLYFFSNLLIISKIFGTPILKPSHLLFRVLFGKMIFQRNHYLNQKLDE